MSSVEKLNKQFAIPGQLRFSAGPAGLPRLTINNRQASAEVLLQGAHLTHWAPVGEQAVIWLSPAAKFATGKSVRGGVPICWPWFGPHAFMPSFPAHGFARTTDWEVTASRQAADGTTGVSLRHAPTEKTREQWPHNTPVELHLTVGGSLDLELVTHNDGPSPVTIGQALHTYFAVGDVRQVQVLGLEDCTYIDKVDGGRRKRQQDSVTIDREVDRVYLGTAGDCVIDDPAGGRRIRIRKRGSHSTVVWNPWQDKARQMGDLGDDGHLRMLCVESCNAADDVVTLAPGGELRLWVSYSLES